MTQSHEALWSFYTKAKESFLNDLLIRKNISVSQSSAPETQINSPSTFHPKCSRVSASDIYKYAKQVLLFGEACVDKTKDGYAKVLVLKVLINELQNLDMLSKNMDIKIVQENITRSIAQRQLYQRLILSHEKIERHTVTISNKSQYFEMKKINRETPEVSKQYSPSSYRHKI